MSQRDKFLEKLQRKPSPKDITYDEIASLLKGLGFEEDNKGKTSGSRVIFVNENIDMAIPLHKPHPQKELKIYQIKEILEKLKAGGLIG